MFPNLFHFYQASFFFSLSSSFLASVFFSLNFFSHNSLTTPSQLLLSHLLFCFLSLTQMLSKKNGAVDKRARSAPGKSDSERRRDRNATRSDGTMAAASTRCRAVLVATLSVALLLTASRVEGFRALAVSDVDLEDGDGDVGVRPFLKTDNLSVGDELTSGNDTVGNVTEVADAPEENISGVDISGEAEDFLGTEDSVTNLTEIANDTTAAGADQTTALEE